MSLHKDAIAGDIHSIANWVVADAAALAALTVTSDDLYKVAYQVDTEQLHVLLDNSPLTWASFGAAGVVEGPAFRAFRGASSQSIVTSTYTKVQFDNESFDTDADFDSTTNYRFTPSLAGYYQFNWMITCHGTGTVTAASAKLYKNGTAVSEGNWATPVGADGRSGGSDIIAMNGSTDYVEVFAYIGQASPTIAGSASGDQSYFSGSYIRGL